jgi:hypothetical protein
MKILPGKRAVIGLLAVLAVMMVPLAASADVLTMEYYLTVPNASEYDSNGQLTSAGLDQCVDQMKYPGFATVNVTLDPDLNMASFTFVANGGFLFGDGKAIDINMNQGYGYEFVSATTNVSGVTLSSDGSGTVDGFGSFNTRFTSGNMANKFASATVEFKNVMADTIDALLTSTLKENGDPTGYFVAAHLACPTGNVTGFATNGEAGGTVTPPVPVPPTVWLLGSGLLGLGLMRWRRKPQLG